MGLEDVKNLRLICTQMLPEPIIMIEIVQGQHIEQTLKCTKDKTL